jgi:3-oxoacyl-[acyl-carrier protein] reductase
MDRQVILITGTRKGIGRHLTEYYLANGYIVVGCSRSESDLVHENYKHYCLDVTDEATAKNLFREIQSEYGRLDILINNAGIASMNHSLLTPISTVRKVIETNVVGLFLFSREAAKLMQKRKHGRIINFSTVAVKLNLEGEAIYAASKAAVNSLTHIMAGELGQFGITVNAVGPTPVRTDLIKNIPANKIDKLLERQSIKRFGEQADVVNVIDFFIRPESGFITGQVIYLGGI